MSFLDKLRRVEELLGSTAGAGENVHSLVTRKRASGYERTVLTFPALTARTHTRTRTEPCTLTARHLAPPPKHPLQSPLCYVVSIFVNFSKVNLNVRMEMHQSARDLAIFEPGLPRRLLQASDRRDGQRSSRRKSRPSVHPSSVHYAIRLLPRTSSVSPVTPSIPSLSLSV